MSFLQRAALSAVVRIALGAPANRGVPGVPATTRLIADCDETIDSTDSFSMNCSPTVIPDMSDQLTEAEVAQPGWNAVPGGAGGGARR